MSNKYVCYYRNKTIEIESDTTYRAQIAAAKIFKASKSYEVNVILAEKDGEPVVRISVD